MKLYFYYRFTVLGYVEKTDAGYLYTSNIRNEQKLKDSMHLRENNYNLFDSCKRESEVLFTEFKRIIPYKELDVNGQLVPFREGGCRRGCRIKDAAGIDEEDSDWEKLVKISKIKPCPSGFGSVCDFSVQYRDIE